ncbi:hypothetical protein J6590_068153 [Homalodisca vitripennis]|nr:hypothetical protein J6590_068153 [Homalodisca vitripennis]
MLRHRGMIWKATLLVRVSFNGRSIVFFAVSSIMKGSFLALPVGVRFWCGSVQVTLEYDQWFYVALSSNWKQLGMPISVALSAGEVMRQNSDRVQVSLLETATGEIENRHRKFWINHYSAVIDIDEGRRNPIQSVDCCHYDSEMAFCAKWFVCQDDFCLSIDQTGSTMDPSRIGPYALQFKKKSLGSNVMCLRSHTKYSPRRTGQIMYAKLVCNLVSKVNSSSSLHCSSFGFFLRTMTRSPRVIYTPKVCAREDAPSNAQVMSVLRVAAMQIFFFTLAVERECNLYQQTQVFSGNMNHRRIKVFPQ